LTVRALLVLAGLVLAAAAAVILVPRARAGVPGGSAHGSPALDVIPFPGTPDAAANSSIIFSSLTTSEVRSVIVRGSRSGVHRGHLQMLPQGAGTEFVPLRPFTPGERVRVIAHLNSRAAGTASGDSGATLLRFSFGVGVLAANAPPPPDGLPAATAARHGPPSRSFHSAPDLHPTAVSVSRDPDTTSGDIFIAPDHTAQRGPMILNAQGQLVWFLPVRGKAYNFAVQRYQGHRVLTWWQGHRGGADGEDVIMGHSYRVKAVVRAVGTGYSADLHDFQITPRDTAFINAVVPVRANLSSVGGPTNGYVWDNVIQEIDIATGKQLWSWHSYGHIPLNATHSLPHGSSYCDCFHLNSIQQLSDGNLLVSSRNTWSIYKISIKTGKILWTLGGHYNQFRRGTGAGWAWQHDAKRSGNTLTMFDDGAAPQVEQESAAKVLHLEVGKKTVTLAHRYYHRPPLLASAQGSTQLLPNGDVFVGWGTEPDFSEYTRGGKQIMTGSFPLGVTSYRAYRFIWRGRPVTPPALAVTTGSNGSANLWASWNGATDVASWRVLGGSSCSALTPWTRVHRYSFETQIRLKHPPACVEVQALSSRRRVLPHGTSAPRSVG
jgi:hypothetical protein